jgi:hypothetical protein
MALKFQFQFAGADFSRPSSPHRKWLRIGLIALMSALALLAYWDYLHHLMHTRAPLVTHVTVPSAPKAAVPDAVQPIVPVAPSIAVPPTLKKVADESLLAVGSYLMRAVKLSPTSPFVPAVPSEPAAKPETVDVVARTISAAPVAPRPYRVHTDQERLMMAGQTAFGNMIEQADKYPDAYGFQEGDFLSDAKLGNPIPIYTIEESARASYQPGQPVKPLLKPAKEWMFPVMMGDRICCMVGVQQAGHDYVPGSGSKSLAMAWNKILEKWPAEEGYHPLLLVNPDVPGYYFTVPELPVQNITDTIQMFYLHPDTSPADVILASWR